MCLVGESGAGKSSLLRVVAGLVTPTAGRVTPGGPGPGGGPGRPALGWVPQHPTVLAGTVLDNVALGRPGVDERGGRAALEAAQLGPWLGRLPQGLRTRLSGLDAAAQPGGAPQAGRGQVPGRTGAATVAAGRADGRPGPGQRPRRLVTSSAGSSTARPRSSPRTTRRPGPGAAGGRACHGRGRRARPGPRTLARAADGSGWSAATGRVARRCAPDDLRRPAARPGRPGPAAACCVAVGVGLTGELGAIGLLATGAWLLLSAALRPPILLLSVAIGAVQVFALLRGAARYGERLASHDLGLGLQAGLRAWLYRRLERLVPAGLPGGDRGDLLARLISDTEEAQDLVVRAAVPVLAAAVAWCAAVVTAAFLLPAAGGRSWRPGCSGPRASRSRLSSLAGQGGGAASRAGRRRHVGPRRRSPAPRNWPRSAPRSGPLAQLAERERALGARTRAVAAANGLGRAAAALAGGAGLAGVAWAGGGRCGPGGSGPVELGVLVFLALGVAGLVQGLPDALSRLPVSRASLRRLAGLARLPGPCRAGRPPAHPARPRRPGRVPRPARPPSRCGERRWPTRRRPTPWSAAWTSSSPRAGRSRWPARAARARRRSCLLCCASSTWPPAS